MSATIDRQSQDAALRGEARTLVRRRRQTSCEVQRENLLAELLASWKAGAAAGRTLVSELEALSAHIRDLRAEIAAVTSAERQREFIPTATDPLEAVVEMTEGATHGLLDAAGSMEAAHARHRHSAVAMTPRPAFRA